MNKDEVDPCRGPPPRDVENCTMLIVGFWFDVVSKTCKKWVGSGCDFQYTIRMYSREVKNANQDVVIYLIFL